MAINNLRTKLKKDYLNNIPIELCEFTCLKCHHKIDRGIKSRAWKGGVVTHGRTGYIMLHKDIIDVEYKAMVPKTKEYLLEHRYVMAKYLKRCLSRFELVHHLNGNKKDNRIENLEIVSPSQHRAITTMESVWEKRILDLETENKKLRKELSSLRSL